SARVRLRKPPAGRALGGRRLVLPGALVMLPYAAIAGWTLVRALAVGRRPQLPLAIAGGLCGVAAPGQGLVGVGLPGLALVLSLTLTRDWRRLRSREVLTAALALVAVAFPWYHAMLIRHGLPFWNELFGDNHFRRLVIGRFGDNTGGFTYYLRELGYALWPWTAIAVVALPAALARARLDRPRGRALAWSVLWALVAYGIVSISMTKFHHYILPAVPAIAIACGWFLDALAGGELAGPAVAALLLCGLPLLGRVSWDLAQTPQAAQRLLWLFGYDYIYSRHGRPWPAPMDYRAILVAVAAVFSIGTALLALRAVRKWAVALLCVGAIGFALLALDKILIELSPHWGQKQLLATYYRQRRPGDRLVAWQMYWRGETFYSQNELYDPRLPPDDKTVFLKGDAERNLASWMARHRGLAAYFLLERGQLETL